MESTLDGSSTSHDNVSCLPVDKHFDEISFIAFKESVKLVRRIKAMEAHFDSFSSWYQSDIEETCLLPVNLRNLEEDMVLRDAWPELFQDELVQEPTQTLACIGLAMHNIIVNSSCKKGQEFSQHRKIYIM